MQTRFFALVVAATVAVGATLHLPGMPMLGEDPMDTATEVLHCDRGDVAIQEETIRQPEQGRRILRRSYTLYNGDQVQMGRVQAEKAGTQVAAAEVRSPKAAGTVRWFDPAKRTWKAMPLGEATLRTGCAVVSLEGGGECLIYTPKVYEPKGSGTLRYRKGMDGTLEIRAVQGGWRLRLLAPSVPAGHVADYMVVNSAKPLFASPKVLESYWSAYTLEDRGKWCYDGYYFPSPSNYIPTGEDCLYRLTAAYLCKSFAYGAPTNRAAEDLALATLDVMRRQQNAEGYFPTLPGSGWLKGSYSIGPGFYDTRFNSDLAEIYYKLAGHVRCREFDEAMGRYLDFYVRFAGACHRETASGGWLVDDYWNVTGGNRTHTSLNHQLAEMIVLYRFSALLERDDLRQVADKMLLGIRDTAKRWVRSDKNLHYAVYADGSYGGHDYPELTYNDLFHLRTLLTQQGEEFPAELQSLMDAKLIWMQRNGVTTYEK